MKKILLICSVLSLLALSSQSYVIKITADKDIVQVVNKPAEGLIVVESSNIESFETDAIFDNVRAFDGFFLNDIEDVYKGVYLSSDFGGLPFPMSFNFKFKESITVNSFKIGSKDNGQGTRLRDFSVEKFENNEWVMVDSFVFQATKTRGVGAPIGFERQEFQLSKPITTKGIRISALSTSDYYAGGRVLFWGLSFN